MEKRLRRKNPDDRCEFCTLRLESRFAGKLKRKYCDGCTSSPRIKRLMHNLYQKRAYRKRNGLPVPEIEAARLVN